MVRSLTAGVAALVLVAAPAAFAQRDEQWAVSPETVLDLPGAWQLAQGAGVVVAAVDSGATVEHPDLAPNLWRNPGERPGNDRDDDGNGFVDDVHGVNVSGSGASGDLSDDLGHGTHVAGTIAAAANGRGVIGVAYRAKVMVVKVIAPRGTGRTQAMAKGIRYAVDNGARIVNVSLDSPNDDATVRAAIKAAQAADVLVVCSAGNKEQNVDQQPLFPVAIPAPNLLGVGATAPANGLALTRFSNYGSLTVPVAAPGEGIVSTSRDGGYEKRSGTSMATPHVAGVAALMASANPRLSAPALRALLLEHAVRSPEPGRPGVVEALASVQAAIRTPADPLDQAPTARILSATVAKVRAAKGRRAAEDVLRIAYRVSGAAASTVRVKVDGATVATLSARAFARPVVLRNRSGRRVAVDVLGADARVLAAASMNVGATPAPAPSVLRLAGSSAAGRALATLLRAAPPTMRVELVGGGTGMGIGDAARGIVDAGLTSRAIFPSDPAGLVFTAFAGRDGCVVTNGALTQLPADGVASAAPPEFLADLGTRPRTFASSADAAAHVRATPGAWGFVDPSDTIGLTVGDCRSYPLGLVTRGAPAGPLAGLLSTIAPS